MMTNSFSTHASRNGELLPGDLTLLDELCTCRAIADRCAFVVGPARSGTTILRRSSMAMTGLSSRLKRTFRGPEAPGFSYVVQREAPWFRKPGIESLLWPNFGHRGELEWWKWLARAAEHFDLVGDKLAFANDQHLSLSFTELMAFFETRFFRSKYIFIFRDPVQSVLSSSRLWDGDPVAVAWVGRKS